MLRRVVPLRNGAGTAGYPPARKGVKRNPYLAPCAKRNPKGIGELNTRAKAADVLEENPGSNPPGAGLGHTFQTRRQKRRRQRKK